MKILEDIRKVAVVGGKTYCVTVPLGMIKELGWRKGQKVKVRLYGKKIIIEDWEKAVDR